jgi:hypothetical protein
MGCKLQGHLENSHLSHLQVLGVTYKQPCRRTSCLLIMDPGLTSIDMEDIGYDDILHMHRGWRRSEIELQSTLYELNALKLNCQQMQDRQSRFVSQIASLESIRDFNMSLQHQMERIEREKLELHEANVKLIQSQANTELLLDDFDSSIITRDREARGVRLENVITREHYQEVVASHRELEIMISSTVESLRCTEARLVKCDKLVDSLRLENASIRLKLDSTLIKMNQCDYELAYASLQLTKLAEEVAAAKATTNVEVGVLKRDISRLLKLLEHCPASRSFRRRWNDSHGMSLVSKELCEGSILRSSRSATGDIRNQAFVQMYGACQTFSGRRMPYTDERN